MTASQTVETKCTKCSGRGYLRAFTSVAGGVCFSCKGQGTFTETAKAYQARINRAKADRKRMKDQVECYSIENAVLHAIQEQRADLVVDRFPEINMGAVSSIVQRAELWEEDALWKTAVDNNRRNSQATGY